MDDINTSQERSISGASGYDQAGDMVAHPVAENQQDGDLPMIVWLRGDEANLDEFCLDAEAAMKALGIKRSRLTQISGRELRVGRLRVDRYTRPVYRVQDIESYKNWTRATASHLRASSVIQEAATKLEEQSHHLAEQLTDKFKNYADGMSAALSELKAEVLTQKETFDTHTQELAERQKAEFFSHLDASYENIKHKFDQFYSDLSQLHGDVRHLKIAFGQMDQLVAASALVSEQCSSLTKHVQDITAEQLRSQTSDVSFQRDIGKALSLVIQFQRENLKKQEEGFTQAQARLQSIEKLLAVEAVESKPTMAPKRRMPFALRRRIARRMY